MITGLHHVAISAIDFDRSMAFYRDLFGLQVVFEWEFADGRGLNPLPGAATTPFLDDMTGLVGCTGRQTMLRAPNAHIELFEWKAPAPEPRTPAWTLFDHGITHVCFQVDDLDLWHRRLSEADVEFISGPQTFGPVKSVYALDPDGNIIELLEPRDAGSHLELPNLHLPEDFDGTVAVEGIHHVGISVSDIEATKAFYRDRYNLEALGPGIDFSDGRFDEIWQATGTGGLAAFMQLGNSFLEVFEFHAPVPKPRAPQWRVCDHGYTHFSFQMPDVAGAYEQLTTHGVRFNCPPFDAGRVRATYSHDLWGNLVELFEPNEEGAFLSIEH